MFASCTGFVRCLAVGAARVIFGGIRMRWRVGEYWLSLRDLTKLNIGHRQRRDDPTDVCDFATFATFAKSIKHRPKSIKHSPAASRPANQEPLKNTLGRFAANLSKNLSENHSKANWRYEVTLGGFAALPVPRFRCRQAP
jgi:hypothetical protein